MIICSDSPDSDVELLFTEYRNYCKEVDQRARENAFTREAMESSNQEGSRKLRSGRTTFDVIIFFCCSDYK